MKNSTCITKTVAFMAGIFMLHNSLQGQNSVIKLQQDELEDRPVALVGATVIDLSNFGNNDRDIPNSVVIFEHGKITKVGSRHSTVIPKNAAVIDVTGKFIVPGLIDGFSTINNQGQANAHLYMGVTTVGGGMRMDDRRGEFYYKADPSPHIKHIESVPRDEMHAQYETNPQPTAEDIRQVNQYLEKMDSLKNAGVEGVLVHHRFPPELVSKLMQQAKKYKIATIAEINLVSYDEALDAGINFFVHADRYLLGGMPDSVRIPNMQAPYDTNAFKKFMRFFNSFSVEHDPGFKQYAKKIAASNTALMPTLSLLYSSLPDHKNLWKEPAAAMLDPNDIWLAMDTATGKSKSFIRKERALRHMEVEKGFVKAGAHYVTGSGADAFGTMPGISEHTEIEMLHMIGLTNRQCLAAATANFPAVCDWDDIGLIKEGYNADLLVLSSNPLDDLNNLKSIDRLFLAGKQIDRLQLLKK